MPANLFLSPQEKEKLGLTPQKAGKLRQESRDRFRQAQASLADLLIPKLSKYPSVVRQLEQFYEPLNDPSRIGNSDHPSMGRPGGSNQTPPLDPNTPPAGGEGSGGGIAPPMGGISAPDRGRGSERSPSSDRDNLAGNHLPPTAPSGSDELPTQPLKIWREWRWWGDRWTFTGTTGIDLDRLQPLRRPNSEFFPIEIDPNKLCIQPNLINAAKTDLANYEYPSHNDRPAPLLSLREAPGSKGAKCTHDRAIPGLDHVLCPDCNRSFVFGSPIYQNNAGA
jgi:hypothetical protein